MFPLSVFDIGLIVMIVSLLVLYLIVLFKLNSSTEGKEILKRDLSKQKISEGPSTERSAKPDAPMETRKKPIETEKTEISKETRNSGCPYYFGYLGGHPKNTPIPNECFTCTKIMECLLGVE